MSGENDFKRVNYRKVKCCSNCSNLTAGWVAGTWSCKANPNIGLCGTDSVCKLHKER